MDVNTTSGDPPPVPDRAPPAEDATVDAPAGDGVADTGPSDDQPAVAAPVEDAPPEVLSESECWKLLRSVDLGRIAIAAEDCSLEIFPINFAVDHGTIVFRTATGTKLTRVGQASQFAFEADDFDVGAGVAWSVIVNGDAETVQGRADVIEMFDIDLHPWHNSSKPFFVRLVPTSISGRRFVRTR